MITILLSLINIAKPIKSQIACGGVVTLENFIKYGYKIFKMPFDKVKELYSLNNPDDLGYLAVMLNNLNDFLTSGKDFCLVVDSTASGIFHLNILLKFKSDHIKYLNLSDSNC